MSGLVKFDHEGFRSELELEVLELTKRGLERKGTWKGILSLVQPEPSLPYPHDGEDLRNVTFTVLIALVSRMSAYDGT